jgi:hypothetical protein
MNSRDSAYDIAIAASLAEIAAKEAQEEEDDAERKGIKRRRVEEEEVGEHEEANVKRAKKKKDEEAGMECESKRKISTPHVHADPQQKTPIAVHDSTGAPKAKHPNQYTYRPKGPGQPDHPPPLPISKIHNSPVKKTNPDVVTRKVAVFKEPRGSTPAAASSKADTPTVAIGPFTWGLPDHLSAFGSLLPETTPSALEVFTPVPRPSKQAREPAAVKLDSHLEPPHKVRYPAKRMTVAEMKKRVRSMLEFVGRIQVEEGKRVERGRLLGLNKVVKDVEPNEDVEMVDPSTESTEHPSNNKEIIAIPSIPSTPKSIQIMDEITRDLIRFQEQFEAGTFPPVAPSASGSALPIPSSVSMGISASQATQVTNTSSTTTAVGNTVPVVVVSGGEEVEVA